MLERFLDLYLPIGQTLLKFRNAPPMVSVTKDISGQKYVTSSLVILMVKCMITTVESANKFKTKIGKEFAKRVLANLEKWFGLIEYNSIAAITILLDPRFKTLHFTYPTAAPGLLMKSRVS